MKAIQLNGNIKTFRRLPSTWEDEKGLHLNFTKVADPKAFGFYDVVTPSYDSQTQRLSAMLFDAAKEIYTHTVEDIDFAAVTEIKDEEGNVIETKPVYDTEALKQSKIQAIKLEARKILSSTDWYVWRLTERAIEIPEDVSNDRLDILTKSNTFEDEIIALTSYVEVLKYTHTFFPQDNLLGEPITE
jgi:hypothetical protein